MEKKVKLSLSSLLTASSLSQIKGGDTAGGGNCSCGCHGSSSTCDNSAANFKRGLKSIGGGFSCSENTLDLQQFWLCCT